MLRARCKRSINADYDCLTSSDTNGRDVCYDVASSNESLSGLAGSNAADTITLVVLEAESVTGRIMGVIQNFGERPRLHKLLPPVLQRTTHASCIDYIGT